MDDVIMLESGQPEDAEAILKIHSAAVRQTAAPYYSEDIINSWARPTTAGHVERIKHAWLENPDHRVVVAKQKQQIVGFGFIHKNNELRCLYVHPDHGRQGIGAKLFAALEQEAISLGLTHFDVNASLNAADFYRKQGFETVEQGIHRLGSGLEMACVKMRKELQ